MPTTPSQFRFTEAEIATMDELVRRRGYKSRVALLRALVAEAADPPRFLRPDASAKPGPVRLAETGVYRDDKAGVYSDSKDCPHPIGRRIGKACSQCGKDPA